MLPARGSKLPAPKWPTGTASKAEAELWRRLWASPIACWWREQMTEPTVVARYVRLAVSKPALATLSRLESDLGLSPAAMLRLRLMIEPPEVEEKPASDPYSHLRIV